MPTKVEIDALERTIHTIKTQKAQVEKNLRDIKNEIDSMISVTRREYPEYYVQRQCTEIEYQLRDLERINVNLINQYEDKIRGLTKTISIYKATEEEIMRNIDFKEKLIDNNVNKLSHIQFVKDFTSVDLIAINPRYAEEAFVEMILPYSLKIDKESGTPWQKIVATTCFETRNGSVIPEMSSYIPLASLGGIIDKIKIWFKKGKKLYDVYKKVTDVYGVGKAAYDLFDFFLNPRSGRADILVDTFVVKTIDIQFEIDNEGILRQITMINSDGKVIEITIDDLREILHGEVKDDVAFLNYVNHCINAADEYTTNNLNTIAEDLCLNLWTDTNSFGTYGNQNINAAICQLINENVDNAELYVKDGRIVNLDLIISDLILKQKLDKKNAKYLLNILTESMKFIDEQGYNAGLLNSLKDAVDDAKTIVDFVG